MTNPVAIIATAINGQCDQTRAADSELACQVLGALRQGGYGVVPLHVQEDYEFSQSEDYPRPAGAL